MEANILVMSALGLGVIFLFELVLLVAFMPRKPRKKEKNGKDIMDIKDHINGN